MRAIKRTVAPVTLALALSLGAAAVASSGCGDEAQEAVLCASVADQICDKWFDCWPLISAGIWLSEAECRTVVRANCSNSEVLHGCDLDNADLMDCDDRIGSSVCGDLPASCTDMVDCLY